MLSYLQTAAPASLWPEPLELIWQIQPGGWTGECRWKRRDITLTDRAFIAAVVNLPRGQRPWGVIVWLADVYHTSRETLYTIGRRVRETLLCSEQATKYPESQAVSVPTRSALAGTIVAITDNRLKRTVLTLLLPGGVTLRPMQDCLQVALDVTRSVGFLSEFINEAGRRAGTILDEIDYSPLGDIILARDETYFNDWAFLIGVDPCTYVLLAGQVEESCDGETWGLSLAFDQSRVGLQIVGLAEDGARFYPRSQREAGALLGVDFSVPVQKDIWHTEDKAAQTVVDLERIALRKLTSAEKMIDKLPDLPWDEAAFDACAQVEEDAEGLVELSGQVRFWYGCLCDALEIVDWRSGEIRDRETNQWLLRETIQALQQLNHPRVRQLVTHLREQQDELLTFLDWLEVQLVPWQRKLARALPDVQDQLFFQRTVARAWRLNRALVNGHRQFRAQAESALALVADLVADDEHLQALAEELLNILENVIRTSCAAETVNSVLKSYLWVKRSFQSRETAQNWFNLFRLWFCMHLFKRSTKRQGKSPFQLAGIKVYTPDGRETDDWLEALGYPADA
jgi:hypothetical protein